MRKGDEKKQELLNMAERLFCTKGYEATSVQDILDAMHTSKGGFYHYFVSKDSVLETLCRQRAEVSAAEAQTQPESIGSTVMRMNQLLNLMMPLREEQLPFISMLLPLLDRPEGLSIRVCYQDALAERFLPMMSEEIERGYADGTFHPVSHEMATPILTLANACWLEALLLMLKAFRRSEPLDPAAVLAVLDKYRRSIEILLDAPYGSIEPFSLEAMTAFAEKLLRAARKSGRI